MRSTEDTKFGVAIRCRDLDKSLAFYEGLLGFDRQWEDNREGNRMVGLRAPLPTGYLNVTLDEVPHAPESVPGEFGVVIGVSVSDVKATVERLATAGHGMRIQPADGSAGELNAAVFDPDAHEVWLSASESLRL